MTLRILWLARALPFPLTAGDRIYTARLAEALAHAGADITFVGHEGDASGDPLHTQGALAVAAQTIPGINWQAVAGGVRGKVAALASLMPLVAARHDTPAYRAEIARHAAHGAWSGVVIDQYGMGWVLEQRSLFRNQPPFIFVTHDHEESVTRLQWQDRTTAFPTRLYLGQNHLKARQMERRTARASDLLTAITAADAVLFRTTAPTVPSLVLTPGYAGPRLMARRIDANTPRNIVLLGSYRWSAKQANLRLFLDRADPLLATAGIGIRIVGDIAKDVRRAMEQRYPAVQFSGPVADPTQHLDARLALLAEPIGGGFKMKLLDYVFNRVPVAALDQCAEGLPEAMRGAMILCPELDELLHAVIASIDDVAALDTMQKHAFAVAEDAFAWRDRGTALHDAITTLHPSAIASSPRLENRMRI